MKFTEGMWFMRKGMRAIGAGHVCEVHEKDGGLELLVHAHRIADRGATLGGPLFIVRLHSPMAGVIRVRYRHFKGTPEPGPSYSLQTDPAHKPKIEHTKEFAALHAGCITARVKLDAPFTIEFLDGDKLITRTMPAGRRIIEAEGEPFTIEQHELGVGECIYGLGERFTPFVKNGQSVDIWNNDSGTGSDMGYKNVPFHLSSRGYGVLVNHPERVGYEIASERVSHVQFSVPGRLLDYCIVNGPTPKEALSRYTALLGRPALPPAWSFGLWLTTSFTTDYDEKTVTEFVQGMADRKVPLHVFHFDCFWMKEFRWCDFEWDRRVFPDPAGMLKRLKDRGLRICVWINPYIGEQSVLFDEGVAGGYLVKKPNGDVWQMDEWQPGMALVDFTNPAACTWYAAKLRALLDMGVDCFKTDFGERIPTEVKYHDGSDPMKMHNYYTYLYNKVVFGVLEEARGKGEAAVFARSATAGCQRFPVHWGGDCRAEYTSMAESLRGGLSLCLSGFGFWSHDIGGFFNKATPDLYKRWVAFGLLSTHSRLHGEGSYRVPWLYDEESVDVLRFFVNLKCRLMPYLFTQACETSEAGVPMLRAMLLEFPGDPACLPLDRQYMLGGSLLVAPVFNDRGAVEYYLPEGKWTNYIDGTVVQGPCWRRETHGYTSLPLMVRPNTVLAVGTNDQRPDYDFAAGVTFQVFELGDGAEARAEVRAVNGAKAVTCIARRKGGTITVEVTGATKLWRVQLRGVAKVRTVQNGDAAANDLGVVVTPAGKEQAVAIEL